jgi:FeS assembly SUF system regulator
MLRITRQADYGIVLLTTFARLPRGETVTASELARRTRLPAPTVTKVLKLLAREGLLTSHRGVQGGYQLARAPAAIDLVEVISVLEGPIALTQCSAHAAGCEREPVCPVRPNWQRIDNAVRSALAGITLADMAEPPRPLDLALDDGAQAADLRDEDRQPPHPAELAAGGEYS